MTEYELTIFTFILIGVSSCVSYAFLSYMIFKILKRIDEKYTYINEIFKHYLECEDDKQ